MDETTCYLKRLFTDMEYCKAWSSAVIFSYTINVNFEYTRQDKNMTNQQS